MPRMHPAKLDLAFSDGARPHFYFAWGCFRNFGSRLSDAPRPGHEAVNASHRGEVIQLDAPHPVERRMQACKAPAGRGNRFQWPETPVRQEASQGLRKAVNGGQDQRLEPGVRQRSGGPALAFTVRRASPLAGRARHVLPGNHRPGARPPDPSLEDQRSFR